MSRRAWGPGVFLLVLAMELAAQGTDYPEILQLSGSRDPLFLQQQQLVDLAYQSIAAGRPAGDLSLFLYRVRADDTIFSLASRFNLPYETLATLNALGNAEALKVGQRLLVPTQPGLFVALDHPGELDRLMLAWRGDPQDAAKISVRRNTGTEGLLFFSGARFHPLERAFFLGLLFRFPLPQARLTSPFGVRSNPFTGHPTFHAGIDLAAPLGTEVYAARDGRVQATGFDRILGNFVRLDHGSGYETVYGHLNVVVVSLHQEIRSGMILGRVGSTGQSTGPHLHFEIRREGHPEDPVPLLPTRK